MKIIETNLKFKPLAPRTATKMLIIHHTGSGRAGSDPDAKTIHGWHLNNGWSGIGYHYLIRKSGQIERGRPEMTQGSHCRGVNSVSIGIHVGGDFNLEEPTDKQILSLIDLCAHLCMKHKIQSSDIYGHYQKSASDCPGKNMKSRIVGLRRLVHDKILQLKG